MNEAGKSLNNSVLKAFHLLEYFTLNKQEWGVRELASEIGANKSTVYRLLATLEKIGVLKKDAISEKYSLGLKLFELGNRVDIQSSFVNYTHPVLQQVALEITETVHLGILRTGQVLMVDKIESPMGLKLNSSVGMVSPSYCSGIGKVLLASLKEKELDSILKTLELKPFTKNTITAQSLLKKELQLIKKQGFGIDKEELELGLICVAVPVFNKNKEVIAALSAAGPANRFREEALEDYVETLKTGALEIEKKIGNFRNEK